MAAGGARAAAWRWPLHALTFLLALPLAVLLRDQIAAQLGTSVVAAAVADGVSYDWWTEFSAQAGGLGATFTPSIIGFGSTLDALSRVLDARYSARLAAVAARRLSRALDVPERRHPRSLCAAAADLRARVLRRRGPPVLPPGAAGGGRGPRLLAALPLRAPVAVPRSLSRPHPRPRRRAHGAAVAPAVLRALRRGAARRQSRRRLRAHPPGGGGSPQRRRRAAGVAAFRAAASARRRRRSTR